MPSIKWRHLDKVAMPHKMYNFGHIKTKDESQIVIFGGKTKTGFKDEIWILTLGTFQWTKSCVSVTLLLCMYMCAAQATCVVPRKASFMRSSRAMAMSTCLRYA